jgi:hypothetical protein
MAKSGVKGRAQAFPGEVLLRKLKKNKEKE